MQKRTKVRPLFLDSLSPGQCIHLDFLEFEGKYYLILKDAYSGWHKYYSCKDQTGRTVIGCLHEFTSIFGLPSKIVTDGGPCFTSQVFQEYLSAHHILHHQTSAYHPASNGLVERGVRSLKDILKKVQGPITKSLIDEITFSLNNHPSAYEGTPNQRFLGRSPRSNLPNSMKKFVDREDLVRNRLMKQQRLAERYGRQSSDQFALQDRVVVRDPGTG